MKKIKLINFLKMEGIGVQEVDFQEVDFQEVDFQEIGVQEVGVQEIGIGDFIKHKITYNYARPMPHKRIGMFEIKSIKERDSGYVIISEHILNPDYKFILVKHNGRVYYDNINNGQSQNVKEIRNQIQSVEFFPKPSLSDIPSEFRDLLNKEYTTEDTNVVYKMTIPLLYNVSFDYPNVGYLDTKEYPEKLFMDLYERKPMPESLNDLDLDFRWSIRSYGRLSGFLTIVGKVNASEQMMADLPNDSEQFDYFIEELQDQLYNSSFIDLNRDLSEDIRLKILNFLMKYRMGYYADDLYYDLFDISDKDFNLLARSDWARDTDDIFGEYTSREIEDWIWTDFKFSINMKEVRFIDFLESLYRNRSFFFRGAEQIQIIDSMDKLLKAYVINLDYQKLIIEGDANDILIRTLINKIKEPIMTKSALKR